jgi:hypothetical protein
VVPSVGEGQVGFNAELAGATDRGYPFWVSNEKVQLDTRRGIIEAGLDSIGASVSWLTAKLSEQGCTLHPESRLAQSLASLEQMRRLALSGESYSFKSGVDAQRWYLSASGADFLSKALHRGALHGLRGFDPMFKHLSGGDPVLTGPAIRSNKRDLSWELLLASLIATFSENVRAEEPDITCGFENQRLGVAAKVLYSDDPATHLDRVKEGAAQLERSVADSGFVVLNMVQLFPHERMFANFNRSKIRTRAEAVAVIDGWSAAFFDAYDLSAWARRLKSLDKLLCVMFFVPTVVHLHDSPNPLVPYYRMHLVAMGGREERARAFTHALNWSCQTVLSFRAPSASG